MPCWIVFIWWYLLVLIGAILYCIVLYCILLFVHVQCLSWHHTVSLLLLIPSRDEQTKNPNAVINALKTYEKSFRHKGENKYIITDSIEDLTSVDEGEDSDKSRGSSQSDTPTAEREDVTKPAGDDAAKAPSLPAKEKDLQVSRQYWNIEIATYDNKLAFSKSKTSTVPVVSTGIHVSVYYSTTEERGCN